MANQFDKKKFLKNTFTYQTEYLKGMHIREIKDLLL